MITVYTKNNCMPCKMTKRKLQELGVNYKEHNVDEEPEVLEYLMEKDTVHYLLYLKTLLMMNLL